MADANEVIAEARVAVNAAIMAASSVAMHHIIPSADFDRMMGFLYDAAAVLRRVEEESEKVENIIRLPTL